MTRIAFSTPVQIAVALPQALEQLRADRLIAYPTETVYGFGGAVSTAAAATLRALKRREAHKPFLLLVTEPAQVPGVQWTDTARTLARLFWPGPLTLALAARADAFPDGIVSEDGMVALRATPHDAMRTLLHAFGAPLTSTSANAPGRAPARSAAEADAALTALDAGDVLILDGGILPASPPSTVVACEHHTVRVLREGVITRDELRNRLQGTGVDVE